MRDQDRPVSLRPLRPGEHRPLLEVFAGLGDESRRRRFHGPKPRLTERDLATLADLGSVRRPAVAAVERSSGRAIGVAELARVGDDADTAEIAFAVVDAWQGHGVGRMLLEELVRRARAAGIERLSATVGRDNAAALALLRRAGSTVAARLAGGGTLEIVVAIGGRVGSRPCA